MSIKRRKVLEPFMTHCALSWLRGLTGKYEYPIKLTTSSYLGDQYFGDDSNHVSLYPDPGLKLGYVVCKTQMKGRPWKIRDANSKHHNDICLRGGILYPILLEQIFQF